MVDSDFALWYQQQIRYRGINDPLLVSLSWGPSSYAKVWHSYVINGYTYHTVEYGEGRPTMKAGYVSRPSVLITRKPIFLVSCMRFSNFKCLLVCKN
ncbi:unnamed protein product [Cuscuta europaea]|uniref:Uncharacterized protein n=1 Tax=Cuscuta europaea TaxID=41803 RepID=A0A9P0Z717_CUSEU|nr:unnamed protein product [Cuscuta europaea]